MTVDISGQRPATVDIDALQEFVAATLEREGVPDDAELSISFIGNEEIATLNEEHLGKSGPTDVLSFPIEDFSNGIVDADPAGPPLMLGDVVICPAVVRANADASGVAFEDEMALMVVHGILHLLGSDHVIEAEAEAMELREREILALVGRQRP